MVRPSSPPHHAASACAVCTQCPRSAHAVPTQCTRSAHAVQHLGHGHPFWGASFSDRSSRVLGNLHIGGGGGYAPPPPEPFPAPCAVPLCGCLVAGGLCVPPAHPHAPSCTAAQWNVSSTAAEHWPDRWTRPRTICSVDCVCPPTSDGSEGALLEAHAECGALVTAGPQAPGQGQCTVQLAQDWLPCAIEAAAATALRQSSLPDTSEICHRLRHQREFMCTQRSPDGGSGGRGKAWRVWGVCPIRAEGVCWWVLPGARTCSPFEEGINPPRG